MIYDTISNLKNYAALAPEAFEKLTAFLATLHADSEDGRTELLGKDLYVMVQRYNTHPFDENKVENHREYADVQLLLDGSEVIYYGTVDNLDVTMDYDAGKDCAFFRSGMETLTPLMLIPGNFTVFLPEEGHAPGCGDPAKGVVKVVAKIHRSLLGL